MKYVIISKKNAESLEIKQKLIDNLKLEYDEKEPNFAIAIGGDGTILRTFHKYPNATIIGVHTGHLGFYTSYLTNEIDDLILDLNNDKVATKTIDLLSIKIYTERGYNYHLALNEATVVSASKSLMLDIFIDDLFFERFRGTGLCVSTPTGSTAYNKSLGGAVIDSNIDVYQLTEMAGINNSSYKSLNSPFVLSSERRLRIRSKMPTKATITIDNASYELNDFQMMSIMYKKDGLKIAFKDNTSFTNKIIDAFLK